MNKYDLTISNTDLCVLLIALKASLDHDRAFLEKYSDMKLPSTIDSIERLERLIHIFEDTGESYESD